MSESSEITVILLPPDQNEPGFHVKDYKDQRPNLAQTNTGKVLSIRASLDAALHGTLTPGGDPASLILLAFNFSASNVRRFEGAEVSLIFAGAESERGAAPDSADAKIGTDPECVAIEPEGRFSICPTVTDVSTENSWNLSAQGGPPTGGASFQAGLGGKRNESYKEEDEITVTGKIRQVGRDDGPDNTAIWALGENEKSKKGIPDTLRAAVLLKREKPVAGHSGRFKATISIEAWADFKSSFENKIDKVRGKVPTNDPVYFDPRIENHDKKWSEVDLENLNEVDWQKLIPVPVLTKTILKNAVLER